MIVGSSSNTQVDVTFGFELNEQLLALSIQPSPPPPPPVRPPPSQQEEVQPEEAAQRVEPVEQVNSASTGLGVIKPDFAARYRERPELLNPPKSRRSYEIVDFISQGLLFIIIYLRFLFLCFFFFILQKIAWKRIERKLDEQLQGNNSASSAGGGLQAFQSSGIRVYTMD